VPAVGRSVCGVADGPSSAHPASQSAATKVTALRTAAGMR
jgi:hypothetical protein